MKIFSAAKPIIYLITSGKATTENFAKSSAQILRLIEIASASSVSLIQIREKQLPARLVFELAQKASRITRKTRTKLLVNDRADIALTAAADGVHLTANSIPVKIVRQIFPANFIIGVSAHTLEEAEKAMREEADFVTFSPIFETPSKAASGASQGVEKLREVCEKLAPFPIIALGGVDETNCASVLEAGASGFAAIRFLNKTENCR